MVYMTRDYHIFILLLEEVVPSLHAVNGQTAGDGSLTLDFDLAENEKPTLVQEVFLNIDQIELGFVVREVKFVLFLFYLILFWLIEGESLLFLPLLLA